jgi:hypothetical protein
LKERKLPLNLPEYCSILIEYILYFTDKIYNCNKTNNYKSNNCCVTHDTDKQRDYSLPNAVDSQWNSSLSNNVDNQQYMTSTDHQLSVQHISRSWSIWLN